MVQFIKIGADRIKLDTIKRYGIKSGVRYLVKEADELGVEVDGAIFDSAYTEYGASWREEEDIKTSAPIHDMNTGLPVKINGKVVGYGCVPQLASKVGIKRFDLISECLIYSCLES